MAWSYLNVAGAWRNIEEIENSVAAESERDILITGSMLPLYYTEKIQDLHQPVLSHLERVAALKERGYLTEEEFNLCKSKLFRNIKH